MLKIDGKIVARRNEEAMLKALNQFGWLRTRDLAALIWQKGKKKRVSFELQPLMLEAPNMRTCQIVLARLRRKRMVNRIKAPDASWIYGLAVAGARELNRLGIEAKSAEDSLKRISLSFYHHRRIANEVAIIAAIQGFEAVSEFQIAKAKWFGGITGVNSKKPDALCIDGKVVTWIEVERSRRNKKDWGRLMTWLLGIWPADRSMSFNAPLLDGYELLRVLFVCEQPFIDRVMVELKAAGWPDEVIKHRIAAVPLEYVTEAKFIQR